MEDVDRKRRNLRFVCALVAEVAWQGGAALQGRIVNLSKEGCLIELEESPASENQTAVEVVFQLNGVPFRIAGTVRSRRADNRIGIQFDQLHAGVGRQLATLSAFKSLGAHSRRESDPAERSQGIVSKQETVADPSESD